MTANYSDREISIFLKGLEYGIRVAEKRPRGISIIRAMKEAWTELSLRQERMPKKTSVNVGA